VARAVVQLGIGTVHGSWLGLMAGELAGRASGIGRLRRECLSQLRDQLSPFTIGELARTLAVYRKFPLVSLPSSLLDVMALSVAVPLVSELYGADAAGQFALVQLVCAVPVALVGVAVADAFHSRIALFARQAPGRARALFLKTAAGLFAAGVGPLAVLALAGPVLFRIAFGQQWSVAGELASVMAPWALAQLVVSPVSQVAFVFRAQEFKLIYDVLNLTTVTAVLLVGQRSLSLVPVVVDPAGGD
jgi:O-antigen/teichoic acid export membrane protein